jgi:hypothetical protein
MLKTKKRPVLLERGWIAGMACLAVAGLLAGCKSSAPPTATTEATATQRASRPTANTVSERLRKSTKILTAAMDHPKTPFHYSYKGQQNVTEHYAFNKTLKPQVGTVTMEADVSPDEMIITSMWGGKKEDHNAKKSDEFGWGGAQLSLMANVTEPVQWIDVLAGFATEAGSDTVGGVAADKFTFDSSTVTAAQKFEYDAVMPSLCKAIKVAAWVAKDSGELVKFTIDESIADERGAWEEHREGEVTPK